MKILWVFRLPKLLRFNLNSSNSKTEKFCKYAVFLFPIFFILLLVTHKFLFGPINEDYINFVKEDGIVEYTTTILFFLSFVFSLVIALNFIKVKNKIFASFYILLSVAFLFTGFEEISWGQRIFDLETTEFFSENVQNEINFHNLPSINPYPIWFLVSLTGSFFCIFLSKLKTKKFKSFIKFFIPQPFLMFYFIPGVLFYVIREILREEMRLTITGIEVGNIYYAPAQFVAYFFVGPDKEVIELLLSAGIFLFLFSKILGWRLIENRSKNRYFFH